MSQTPAEIEADIVRQREQLATTVDLLQTRVKATAIHQAKLAGVVAGAAVVVLLGVVVVRRVRR
ncbi:DUF3618 domain-containing protein [Nocardioides lianchengensis]|uniref:DUF3618 domain-containing protein n=1 Tax=Nocardioides lianchengensis TaxID=1045774 RepID=A0A1G6VQ40_9ACTN|nr:DUF3618 domain-containing protein [Nocardioides lianchengensis]NYG11256.1 hypothetical protein [Nocardioides lianchengensis]SDD55654.1 Protein of unknown function [Nocardioides lianchengensis]